MKLSHFCLGAVALTAPISTSICAAQDAKLGVAPDKMPALAAAARGSNLPLVEALNPAAPRKGLLVLETSSRSITAEQAARIGEWVRGGGSLLLALGKESSITPTQLSFLLPATVWQLRSAGRGVIDDTLVAAQFDAELFGALVAEASRCQ